MWSWRKTPPPQLEASQPELPDDVEAWSDEDEEAEWERLQERDRQAPWAALVESLLFRGFAPSQVVDVVRVVELNRMAVCAEMSATVSTKRKRTSADTKVDKRVDTKRGKWARQKRNQR